MTLLPRTRRALVVAAVVGTTLSTQAFADTAATNPPVTLAVVNGQRLLQVTGSDLVGPASLGFGTSATEAPFGVLVTDLAHARTGYDVSATLSDLYRLDPTQPSGFDCASSVASSQFGVGFGVAPPFVPDVDVAALLDPALTFTGTTSNLPIGAVRTLLSGIGITEVTAQVQGALTELTSATALMDVSDGANSDPAFTAPAPHADCDPSASSPTSRFLQSGTPATLDPASMLPDLAALLDGADGTVEDAVITPAEAVAAQVLQSGTDQPGGQLYDATRNSLAAQLSGIDLGLLNLDQITAAVVGVMTTVQSDLLLDLVGQSGVYANLPKLVYDPDPNAVSGLYQGTMTVTLTDR
ncbi:MAG TPA: hypothetical protein VHF25_16865 [Nitriliruptorales bacterium]|nr:hypothetical protein [Nitriliruptorales bacterium]